MSKMPKGWALKLAMGVRHSCEQADAFLHFSRFLECLCLNDGALLFADDVADAAHWHQTMMNGQYR